ncbi:Lpg1974 family pore-forming outer membrane protein [Legionella waltersii]|uniref:Outer membrane protein n=1 Tax=Legionella waltersii TaxID=66969 RepID=A0A0W1A527_9GAMM|nr:Lpg1974 family pore-forming outer membrane protein [Legionella waltersii]KTD76446.1 outer membrane protein [Legionella waltersii]SNV14498.1 major outer membrane protein [Legionella waltersii]
MLNRKSTILLSLIASNLGFAGTMGPVCTPGSVTVPCEAKMWDLGVQGLYLQRVTTAAQSYRLLENSTNGVHDALEDWDWAYRLEGSYHFNTGNDITINWTHFDDYIGRGYFSGVYPAINGANQPFTEINTSNFDQVNLVMGQHADFGRVKKMRFYAGVQYASIEINVNDSFANTLVVPFPPPVGNQSVSGQRFDNTDFKGIGPVLGLDYSYDLSSSWSLTANAAASILLGHSRYNIGNLATLPGSSPFVIAGVYGSKSSIVPSLETKLGVNYAYPLSQGVLNVQGGYEAMNYFNAVQGQYRQVVGGVRSGDYGLYGPYFGINYVGNV